MPFGPSMWQAEADTELTLSASPTTAVGQKVLALTNRRYSTVDLIWEYIFGLIGFFTGFFDSVAPKGTAHGW